MKKDFYCYVLLVNMSNMYRRMSEKLIDEFFRRTGVNNMKNSNDLKRELDRIDGRGYKSYKDLEGQYDFR